MREVGRFSDVYQAEVAASFLAAYGVRAVVAERTLATMNPLLQTALGGVRVLAPQNQAQDAVDLLARAATGEFAEPGPEPADPPDPALGGLFRVVTVASALIAGSGYAGRAYLGGRARLGAVQVAGLILLGGFALGWGLVFVLGALQPVYARVG
jgi:hypothetical protein